MYTQDMRVIELNTEYLGVTLGMLMQNAGREVARVVATKEKVEGSRIVILCGVGGNGGDGMVAARHLAEAGAIVEVYLVGHEKFISSPDTKTNWSILKNLREIKIDTLRSESSIKKLDSIEEADILIDALLGFGLTSKVREPVLTAIKMINKSDGVKYSIDVPSGIDSDSGKVLGSAVKAKCTITMHAPKIGLLSAKEYAGEIVPVAIGIPPEAERTCGTGDLWLYTRPRNPVSRKGDFGKILVVGGSDVYSGAPALAGMASLRAGADLVSVIAPESVVSAIRAYGPNLMVTSSGTKILDDSSLDLILDLAMKNDVIALGPGLGTANDTLSLFKELAEGLGSLGKPLVIDADGLNALAETGHIFESDKTILTPHWGEMQSLLKKKCRQTSNPDERLEHAKKTAERYNAVVLLKGTIDVIVQPDGKYKFNKTGHPAMTVGGTGDVLTGITASLLSQKHGAFSAASAAAFISGLAGEYAAEELGDRILATDCINKIPLVMKWDN